MEFRKVLALRGPNVWAAFPVIEAWVVLGELNETSSELVPGFNDRLKAWLPTLVEHRCSVGTRGGFYERLRRGTYPAHILEHITLELQCLAGTPVSFGRTRCSNEYGVYRCAIEYQEEALARACLESARELLLAALRDTPFDIDAEIDRLREVAHANCMGPSTRAIASAATERGIPYQRLNEILVQLGHGARARRVVGAESDATSAVGEWIAQDKQLTRDLLADLGIPVPEGRVVSDAEDAWAAAQEIGLPVVVKPQYGNHGRGVATELWTQAQVRAAYEAAAATTEYVLLERNVAGKDYRLLVVGDRVIAGSRREPAQVSGDGRSSISALIEAVNRDPRRGEDHATVLSRIHLDSVAVAVLAEQGYTPASVPAAGQVVLIRRAANLSSGGTAVDVTDEIHPEVAARAVEAAQGLGLDIAGVDVVATDIAQPLDAQGGAVIEVNAGPGLRMHLEPSAGRARPVGEAIVGQLFSAGDTGRIPVVGVTGTNGKTTTTRLIAHILRAAGRKVGMTCTDGIYIGERAIERGDCAGPASAKKVLRHPKVEAAVLETARGGIVRAGLGFDRCDVAVVTNLGEGDHLGLADVDTLEQLALVKGTLVKSVSPEGAAVLNADDPMVLDMASQSAGGVVLFSVTDRNPAVREHQARGGRAVYVRDGSVVLAEGARETPLVSLERVAFTLGGKFRFQVENTLAGAAAAWSTGVSIDAIRAGIESFSSDTQQVPARFNLLQAHGATVVIDYAHNASALYALAQAIRELPHSRRSIVFAVAGDRRDADIIRQGEIIGDMFDRVTIYEDGCNRGRADGEVIALLRRGLSSGRRVSDVLETRGEERAIAATLDELMPDDLTVVQADSFERSVRFVQDCLKGPRATPAPSTERVADNPLIEVRAGKLGRAVFAKQALRKGQLVLRGWGAYVPQQRLSFQVDVDKHIRIEGPPIELINHSCEPNCGALLQRGVEELAIHALRDIEPGEELTHDYAAFEYEIQCMTEACQCGAPSCRGHITGYKGLPAAQRQRYGRYIAWYLPAMERAEQEAEGVSRSRQGRRLAKSL